MWSYESEVIVETSGITTFVASRRPPRPTSTTATSAPASAKCSNPKAVVISNVVSFGTLATASLARSTRRTSAACDMRVPLTWTRSQ